MKTFSLNSKKCLTCSAIFAFLGLLVIPFTFAAVPPRPSVDVSLDALKKDLETRHSRSFEQILLKWQNQYGDKVVPALMKIAKNKHESDANRFIAVMGVAKLGGPSVAQWVSSLLSESSWMVKNAALKALTALKEPSTYEKIAPLLKDKALVVRSEAVLAIQQLQVTSAIPLLMDGLKNTNNYVGGKALVVPYHILSALVELNAPLSVAPELLRLTKNTEDGHFHKTLLNTLDSLSGQKPQIEKPVAERLKAWKEKYALN